MAAIGVGFMVFIGVTRCGGGFPSGAGGGRVVFERVSRDGSQIILMNADGSQQQSLTSASENARSPAWSPDGQRIAFVKVDASYDMTEKPAGQAIWVMRKDGGHEQQLTSGPDGHPSWSPDNRTIAYEHGAGVNDTWVAPSWDSPIGIWLMGSDGSHKRALTHPGSSNDTTPRWSPNGRTIVFTRSAGPRTDDLYVIGADGKGLRRLTHHGTASSPVWSPNGRTIAFVQSGGQGGNRTIMAMDTDGKHLRSLTLSDMDAIQPSWSPDGKKLAITVLTDTCDDLGACIFGFGGKAWSIHTINADGSGDKELTKHSDSAPAWQPGAGAGGAQTPPGVGGRSFIALRPQPACLVPRTLSAHLCYAEARSLGEHRSVGRR